ncbi:integrase catalytic domain-containing protein [Microvirga massiliensis]|uniref:integrase catalytic domain-containing protein n=1 Tax=Microvirga massiliensis TaxID=1033741 RepID=UPI00164E55C5|nr:Mu transposase C-terminal domain-containing protein [Microvirga massiliensis]
MAHVPVRIRTGDTVRIDTRRYLVGPPGDQVRVFTDKESGTERPLTHHAILHMMREGRITTDAAYRALDPNVTANLQVDWGTFSDLERESALCKYPFVRAIDELPLPWRDRSRHVKPLIDRIMADPDNAHRPPKPPSFRRVRTWYLRWLVAGRDIRALVDNHRRKGNRTSNHKAWVKEEIAEAINETYRNGIVGSKADAWERARDRILLRARNEKLALPDLGAKEVLGRHAVARTIGRMELYDLTHARHGKREADFLMKAVRSGPPCDLPLDEAEVDHTQLDLIVVDERGRVLGRPWLTVIMDRYSRMILGFSLTFTPPSWVSVMEALRIAVRRKKDLLKAVCDAVGRDVGFEFDWPCYGSPLRLFCDNGPEFRSASMRATEAALNMQIVDLPRASGWLKGRLERWFRTLNQRLIHRAPGTTKSNPRARRNYRSEKEAVLTLADANWVIAKWIVDIYHTEVHSGTGEAPIKRWVRGMEEVGERPAPADEIMVPLTGLVVPAKLRTDGIRFETLRWNSNAFSALRNRLGGASDVTVRIDPYDLGTAYVLDPTRTDDRDAWVEGYLEGNPEAAGMTLYQFRTLRKKVNSTAAAEDFDPDDALARARSSQEITDLYAARRKPGKAPPKEIVRFVTDGRNASEHLRGERHSPDESEDELGSHDHRNGSIASPPPDERGPWRARTAALEPPPRDPGIPVRRVDVEAIEEALGSDGGGPAPEDPPKPRKPIVVRRRRTQ